jgi:hypothetical protein
MKIKDISYQNSTVSDGGTDLGSASGKILQGLLDVIRCGIQKYRVCRILKSMESDICDYLKVEMKYDYFPTKIEGEKSEKVMKTEVQASPDVKIKTEIKSEPKSGSKGGEKETEEDNCKRENEDKKEENVKEVGGTIDEKIVVKEEICTAEEKKNKEENDRKKREKIEKEKKLQIVREKRSIFLKKFLSSDRAEFLVTLPDSYILITASPRYGFELKSVVCNEEPNPFSHLIQIQEENNNKFKNKSENVESGDVSSSAHKIATSNDTKHTPPCKYRPCDSLFHPMSVRVDLTQQLVRSLKSVVLGSHLRYDRIYVLLWLQNVINLLRVCTAYRTMIVYTASCTVLGHCTSPGYCCNTVPNYF